MFVFHKVLMLPHSKDMGSLGGLWEASKQYLGQELTMVSFDCQLDEAEDHQGNKPLGMSLRELVSRLD